MTKNYYFDTDCLSAFLWVRGESILAKLYPGRIVLPEQVYQEIAHVPPLYKRIETMKKNGDLTVQSIMVDSVIFEDYYSMAVNPPPSEVLIGKGEAACIALAKNTGGTLASNNLRDIKQYVERYHLNHITTGDILNEALQQGIVSLKEADEIWANMLKKRRWLPTSSFTEFLTLKQEGLL